MWPRKGTGTTRAAHALDRMTVRTIARTFPLARQMAINARATGVGVPVQILRGER